MKLEVYFCLSILLFNNRIKVLECSAKEDIRINDLFRAIVSLSRVLPDDNGDDSGSGLKRRSSAYVSKGTYYH